MRPLRTAARGMLGAIFVASGARTLADPDRHVPKAKPVTDRLAPALERARPRLPTEARTLVRINGIVQLTGGLLLATRWGRRPAATALAVSLVPTTLAGHPFWAYENPSQRRDQEAHFLKNLSLLGGLLLAAGDTEGRPGLRWRAARLAHEAQRSMRRGLMVPRVGARVGPAARGQVKAARRQFKTAGRQVTQAQLHVRRRAAQAGRRLPW